MKCAVIGRTDTSEYKVDVELKTYSRLYCLAHKDSPDKSHSAVWAKLREIAGQAFALNGPTEEGLIRYIDIHENHSCKK